MKNNPNATTTAIHQAHPLSTLGTFDASEFFRILTSSTFLEADAKKWANARWPLVIQVCTAYVITIFSIRFLMRNRQPFSLFVPLNIWNAFLGIFSIIGAVMMTPEFFSVLFTKGLQDSYCKNYDFTVGTNGYWVWLFTVSKMFELIDTIFLVLRKRPLMFLHWYHHILTMIYAFYSFPIMPAYNRWGTYLNYSVHAFMYPYYFIRSMGFRPPGSVARFITTLQIWQFIISVAILVHVGYIQYIAKTVKCEMQDNAYLIATFMDVTYLILFINFFVRSYIVGGGKAKYKKVPTSAMMNGQATASNMDNANRGPQTD